jgi:uncharacterized protein involved in tolerance to divalent cations
MSFLKNPGSLYIWEKKLCDDQEVLLICKTTSEAFDSLIPVVQRIHLNENPEIISVGIVWWSCQVYGVD